MFVISHFGKKSGIQKNFPRYLTTALNHDGQKKEKIFPLEGIRIMDITRISKIINLFLFISFYGYII